MEQGNVAKKLTGQILENWLLTLADGHGGIQTITKTGTSGLVDTYTIAFADETTSTFTVTNGRSISGLTTSKSGKVTTITITYNDNTTSSFTVRDGENVSSITEYWAVSTSGSQQPQSGWQTTPPTLTATYKYLWHYSKYTFSDGTNTSTTPAVQGVYGDKGDTGNTGTSITSVTKTGTSGLVDTYTIAFSNGTTTTFNVTNGSEIESIEKTSTAGLVDTYTVTMGSGDTHTFTVTNGRSIVSFTQTSGTHAAGTIDVYTMTYNDGDTSQIQVYNGANGTGAVSTVAGIGVSSADGDVPLIIRGYGAPTTATVGQVNQLYFDMTGGIMYICIASAGGSYDWRGMSSAVDSAMSTTSANPLQNRVISNKVGVGSLSSDFTATNLTDAANELMTAMGGKAPTSHASSATTYGKGTSTNYGHVKISDSLTDTTPAATGGIVPSMKAVSDLNGAINAITPLDSSPTSGSTKAISGGAVFTALRNMFYAYEEVNAADYNTLPCGLVYNTGVGANCPTTTGFILVLTVGRGTAYAVNAQFGFDLYDGKSLWYRGRSGANWGAWSNLTRSHGLAATNASGNSGVASGFVSSHNVVFSLYGITTKAFAKNDVLWTFDSAFKPTTGNVWSAFLSTTGTRCAIAVKNNTNEIIADDPIPSGTNFSGQLSWSF